MSMRGCGSGGCRVRESPWGKFGFAKRLWGLVEVLCFGDQCGLMGGLEVVRQLWGLSGAPGGVGGSLGSRDSRGDGGLEVLEGLCNWGVLEASVGDSGISGDRGRIRGQARSGEQGELWTGCCV